MCGRVRRMTPTEAKLAQIYTDFSGIGDLGVDDDIYELGADSVLVVRIALQVEREFDVELPTEIFESTGSIRAVAAWIDQTRSVRHETPGSQAQP